LPAAQGRVITEGPVKSTKLPTLPKAFFEWSIAMMPLPDGSIIADTPDVTIELKPVPTGNGCKCLNASMKVYSHFAERVAAAYADVGGRPVEG